MHQILYVSMGILKTRTVTGRRRLLSVLAAGIALGTAVSTGLSAPALAATTESGTDLTGWTTVVGDGVYAAPGQAPVTSADITTEHRGADSRLRANILNRGIMAHAISYKRVTEASLMQAVHQGSYSFQMPYLPSTAGGPRNAQTVEGGLFVWDGVNTKVDHGTAFQWVLNPWQSNFGQIRVWTGNSWATGGYLKPDTAWHDVSFMVDPANQKVRLIIDGVDLNAPYSRTPKTGWATTVSASLQVEAISLYPGANATTGPQHEVLVRNWNWNRSYTPREDPAVSYDSTCTLAVAKSASTCGVKLSTAPGTRINLPDVFDIKHTEYPEGTYWSTQVAVTVTNDTATAREFRVRYADVQDGDRVWVERAIFTDGQPNNVVPANSSRVMVFDVWHNVVSGSDVPDDLTLDFGFELA